MNHPVQEDENSLLELLNEFKQLPAAEVDTTVTVQPVVPANETQNAEPVIVSTIHFYHI